MLRKSKKSHFFLFYVTLSQLQNIPPIKLEEVFGTKLNVYTLKIFKSTFPYLIHLYIKAWDFRLNKCRNIMLDILAILFVLSY